MVSPSYSSSSSSHYTYIFEIGAWIGEVNFLDAQGKATTTTNRCPGEGGGGGLSSHLDLVLKRNVAMLPPLISMKLVLYHHCLSKQTKAYSYIVSCLGGKSEN